jgi:hypothetical protein
MPCNNLVAILVRYGHSDSLCKVRKTGTDQRHNLEVVVVPWSGHSYRIHESLTQPCLRARLEMRPDLLQIVPAPGDKVPVFTHRSSYERFCHISVRGQFDRSCKASSGAISVLFVEDRGGVPLIDHPSEQHRRSGRDAFVVKVDGASGVVRREGPEDALQRSWYLDGHGSLTGGCV